MFFLQELFYGNIVEVFIGEISPLLAGVYFWFCTYNDYVDTYDRIFDCNLDGVSQKFCFFSIIASVMHGISSKFRYEALGAIVVNVFLETGNNVVVLHLISFLIGELIAWYVDKWIVELLWERSLC